MERRKPGRPSKGEREVLYARLPVPLMEALRFRAAGCGMTVNDFVGETLSKELDASYTDQEALPLQNAS